MSAPDPKPQAPYRASKEEWEALRTAKLTGKPCRICDKPAQSLHHLVGRDLGGDDVLENLVELCGDGVKGCHGKVQRLTLGPCMVLGESLREEETAYVLEKKGAHFLKRYYHKTAQSVGGDMDRNDSSVASGPSASVGGDPDGSPVLSEWGPITASYTPDSLSTEPILNTIDLDALHPPGEGEKCQLCERRVPHKKKPTTPKQTRQLNLGHAPADAVERINIRLADFIESASLSEAPYARLKALDLLLVLGSGVEVETLQGVAQELGWAT